MKFLLLFLLAWVVWRLLRPPAPRREMPPPPPPFTREHGGEKMLCCAHCGVYAPEREMLRAQDGRYYCSPEHLAAGEKSE
ncbi:MAG: hypothetical protein LBC37_06855 [Zoogloeaceae bacterium]|jgi:uncharacterized protein|nr:hypothetical protein [Zoogloeaceae bacterium]